MRNHKCVCVQRVGVSAEIVTLLENLRIKTQKLYNNTNVNNMSLRL